MQSNFTQIFLGPWRQANGGAFATGYTIVSVRQTIVLMPSVEAQTGPFWGEAQSTATRDAIFAASAPAFAAEGTN